MTITDPLVTAVQRPDLLPGTASPPVAGGTGNGHGEPAGAGHGTAEAAGAGAVERLVLLERCGWSLVWLAVLVGACDLWGSWWSWPVVDALSPVLVAVSLAGLVACWCLASPRAWWHQGSALVSALAVAVLPQVVDVHTRIYYGTDAAALDQVAARLLVHGHNPYTASLASAAKLLQTPTSYWTYTVTGGHVLNVSYPAGSFLLYALGYALGFHHEVVDWVDLYAWVASVVLLYFLLPRSLRWVAALVGSAGFFVAVFAGGGTDALFIPLAMVAVWRWDRYGGGRAAGIARWIGPVALGLACSVKQTPWFCVPFLAVGIVLEARRAGRRPVPVAVRYLAVAAAVFAAVNLPFVVWDPAAWWRGVLTPMAQPLVPDGQGLVSLALHGLTGGVVLRLLMVASMLALLAALAAFVAWYRRLKRIWILLLPGVFFLSPRSFSSYLIDLFPVALVALVSVGPAAVPAAPGTTSRWRLSSDRWGLRPGPVLAGTLAAAAVVAAALSFTGAPLALRSRGAHVGQLQQHLYSVTVTVTNRTGAAVVPRFMVDLGAPHPTGFWTTADHRPVVVGPHGTVTVTLYPPSPMYLPPWASDYVVDAFTGSPSALSTTTDIWHNYVPPAGGRRPRPARLPMVREPGRL